MSKGPLLTFPLLLFWEVLLWFTEICFPCRLQECILGVSELVILRTLTNGNTVASHTESCGVKKKTEVLNFTFEQ